MDATATKPAAETAALGTNEFLRCVYERLVGKRRELAERRAIKRAAFPRYAALGREPLTRKIKTRKGERTVPVLRWVMTTDADGKTERKLEPVMLVHTAVMNRGKQYRRGPGRRETGRDWRSGMKLGLRSMGVSEETLAGLDLTTHRGRREAMALAQTTLVASQLRGGAL